MSIVLDKSGIRVKSHAISEGVFLCPDNAPEKGMYMGLTEFCEMVEYVLENTGLTERDPRQKLIHKIKSMKIGRGYNKGGRRIFLEVKQKRRTRPCSACGGSGQTIQESKRPVKHG